MESLEANVQIGDFQIVKRLGAGGMGIVYLARQVSLDRLVALKVLGTALTDHSEIARFQREAQAIAKLNHPGIAGIHFVGQDRQVCYIVMEYIDGASLRDVLRHLVVSRHSSQSMDAVLQAMEAGADQVPEVRFDQETVSATPKSRMDDKPIEFGSLTPEATKLMSTPDHVRRCCEIVRDAALALAHAHERGVIHRDLKPENLLLDRQRRVYVIDFGLARFFEDVTLTNTGALVGTPLYMSPEQVSGRVVVDHRTDVYSLGIVLYELLTLRRPITAPTREGVLRQVVTKALPPVSWLSRAVPRDLESVVHKATAKDPDDRYQSAALFAADVGNFLRNKPVVAPFYRYRFDEKEIAAERPREIIYISFLLMFMALLGVTSCLILISITLSTENELPIMFCLVYLIGSLVFLVASCCLLTGRQWARLMTAIICAIISLSLWVVIAIEVYGSMDVRNGANSGSIDLWFICARLGIIAISSLPVILVPLLYRRGIQSWFAFSKQLRSEHKQHSSRR